MTTKLPPKVTPAPPTPALQVPYMVAYHGLDGAQHQQRFNELVGQGYRILSCSIYGDPASPRYAFVWVNRPGPAWQAIHGVDAAAFQSWFAHWTGLGYYPTLVSACGSSADPRFTAVLEQVGGGILRFGLRSGDPALSTTLEHQNQWAVQNGWILTSLAVYGGAADRRYAATWSPNPAKTFWHAHVNETATTYQADFDAETQLPFRPGWVSRASDGSYASVFRDDSVGDWVARHELTAAQYQTEFDTQVAAGRMPISVQGGGSGSATRYAAVFARHDQVQARHWTVTGQAVPQLAGFDHALQQFMQANNVRCAQLAIGRGGAVRYARAYTWAEPGYPTTSPDSVMRLASCSKMFTEGAIQLLYDTKKLKPTTKVYATLGLSHPQDARSDAITVQQLLDHTGGYDRAVANWDPVFDMRGIALALGLNRAVTKADVVGFMYKQRSLQHDPGTQNAYSNYGYLLLGYLVEKVSGQSFGDFVRGQLLAPLGIGNVWVAKTTRAGKRSDEVSYDDPGLGGSAVQPASNALVPACYGGEGWLTEVMDSGGGLATNASALVRYVAHYPVWGNGDFRVANYERDGSMAGVSSMTICRGDGIDWAVIFNTRAFPPTSTVSLTQLHQAIDAVFAATPIP
jgi:CubicO group peptidase (beta-lactamase class C family)